MSLSFLFFILLGYILYRFVVGFVLPVARTARGMKKQFDQMKQQTDYATGEPSATSNRQQAEAFTENNNNPSQQRTTSGRKGAKEDYIDFEEIPSSRH